MPEAATSRGVVTIATGMRRYIDMAIALARSLERHAPHLPRAVVTDSTDPVLASLYDQRIAIDHSRGKPILQKLHLDHYTPFQETLAIDADCLVVEDIEWIFGLFAGVPVGVVGHQVDSGCWYGDVATILARIGRTELPKFNGGIYYCDRSSEARDILRTARQVGDRYEEVGLSEWRAGMADEPLIAVALSLHGVRAVDDGGRAMWTPIGMRGWLHIDVLEGRCHFNKGGTRVRPAVVHFAGPFAERLDPRGAFYRRESRKLKQASSGQRMTRPRAAGYAAGCALGCAAINLTTLRMSLGAA